MINWIIAQKWSHVLFMHYEVDKSDLQSLLPEGIEVDLFQDKAYISIVPFFMSHIRFPFTPAFPFIHLWELNLRTYVKRNGVSGIYFFTLDTHDLLGEFIATRFFHLPYRYRQMYGSYDDSKYHFKATDQIEIEALVGAPEKKGALSSWLTERYCLFTVNKQGDIYRGDVIHDSWSLYKVESLNYKNNFTSEFGFSRLRDPTLVSFAKEIDVKFRPFVKA